MTVSSIPALDDPAAFALVHGKLVAARQMINEIVLGQEAMVTHLLTGLLAGGHVLLQGPPGVGKTMVVRTIAAATGLDFARIQFTPDLMPADITGSTVLAVDADGRNTLEFQPGPIFTQLLLADEINRATPRTQSALLEAMQEFTVSAGGKTMRLDRPFFVLATQNPVEMDGTFVLPEAQIDRFLFRLDVDYPDAKTLTRILGGRAEVAVARASSVMSAADIVQLQDLAAAMPVASHLLAAIAEFAVATQPSASRDDRVKRYLRMGLSPRGAQAFLAAARAHALLEGHSHVSFDDLRAVLDAITRHRMQLNFEGQAAGLSVEALARELFDRIAGA